eukprot:jgi/Picre1/27559/NNA_000526.t1
MTDHMQQDDFLAELIQGVEGNPDWLDSLNEGLQGTQLDDISFGDSGHSLKRSGSSPAFADAAVFGHSDHSLRSTTPVAIRPMVPNKTDDFSSLESNQSMFDINGFSSVPEDGLLGAHASYRRGHMKNGMPPVHPLGGRSSGSSVTTNRSNSMPSFTPTVTVPAQGGHWAWVPEPGSDGQPTVPPPFQPPPHLNQVPVRSGRLPLPLSAEENDLNLLDVDIFENFDVLEMANTLVLEQGGTDGSQNRVQSRVHGSCPLPTLLEDTLSVEESGSESTMQNSLGHSGDGSQEMVPEQVNPSGRVRSRPSIPCASLLASSCPTQGERPVRGAARRSVHIAAASLSDAADDQDPEYIDGLERSHSIRSTGGTNSGKKKHNPWSLEETLALVDGVRATGVGKWAEIKRLSIPGIAEVLQNRTPVDLKDKWRNLTRIAKLPKASLKARLQRGQSELSLETMLLVKDLMDNAQPMDRT